MPRPLEYGYVDFNPPIDVGDEAYKRLYAILKEMGLERKVVFHVRSSRLKTLGFETKWQAIMFKLRF